MIRLKRNLHTISLKIEITTHLLRKTLRDLKIETTK